MFTCIPNAQGSLEISNESSNTVKMYCHEKAMVNDVSKMEIRLSGDMYPNFVTQFGGALQQSFGHIKYKNNLFCKFEMVI